MENKDCRESVTSIHRELNSITSTDSVTEETHKYLAAYPSSDNSAFVPNDMRLDETVEITGEIFDKTLSAYESQAAEEKQKRHANKKSSQEYREKRSVRIIDTTPKSQQRKRPRKDEALTDNAKNNVDEEEPKKKKVTRRRGPKKNKKNRAFIDVEDAYAEVMCIEAPR